MWVRLFVSAVLGTTLAAAAIQAQSDARYTLAGIVRDSTGAALMSVEIVVISPQDNRRTTVTDENGRFEVASLPRSTYRVAASAPGFAEEARTITIGDGPVPPVEFILQLVLAEHVQVTAEVQLSASTGLTARTLTGAALDALPDDPAGLLQRVRELAGATGDSGQVTVMIDGFEQALWLPPKHAIQAIRISSNWFAAEFAEPGKARVDIITKPGTSKVRGDVTVNFNDEAMNARNALAPRHPSGQMREVTGYVSGPVIPDRLSFVAYRGYWSQQQTRVINATVLDASYQTASYIDSINAPSRVNNLWLGMTYQVAPAQTLAMSFTGTTDRAENLGLDSGLDLAERAFRRAGSDRGVRATVTSAPSTRVLNELRVQLRPRQSTVQADSAAPAVHVLDAFTAGGNQEALLSSERHLEVEVADAVTLTTPRHMVKAGFETRSAQRRYADATNAGGVFVFGAGFDLDASGRPIENAAGERVVISPLENYRRTLLGLPGYGPSQFWMTRGDSEVAFRETAVGVFVQDDWMARPRVTLSYGLRSEWQTASSEPGIGLRTGVAVALDAARKNVVRAGIGSFFERIEPALTLDVARFDGSQQQHVLVDQPDFFPTVPADLAGAGAVSPTFYTRDAGLRAPHILISAASFERELTTSNFLILKYSYQHGTGMLRTRSMTAPEVADARVLRYESTGQLRRQELSSGWRWNGSAGSLFANYIYVHGRSDTDGRSTVPADGSRLDQEFGPTAADREHLVNFGAQFTLPRAVSVSPYLTAASGRVFDITTGFDNNGDGVFTDRPALAEPGTPGAIQTPYGSFLADVANGAPIATRNGGRDPSMLRVDVRLAKLFRFSTGAAFVVAANVENVTNRANYEGVNGVITSPLFGQPKRAGSPRRVNFAASFNF